MSTLHAAWTKLQADPKALGSLKSLANNKHFLPELSGAHVTTLLQVLQHLHQDQSGTEPQRSAAFSQVFQLLAQWTNTQLCTSRTAKPHLEQAVSSALQLLYSPGCTAQAFPACILFLGAASKGLAEHEREEIAAAACMVLQAHQGQLSSSSEHTSDLRTGIADIMIGLQCQGSSVMWLVVSALALWTSDDEQASSFQTSSATQTAQVSGSVQGSSRSSSSSSSVRYDIVRQAMMLYSMMRQVGAAMLQNKAMCPGTAMQMTELLAAALQSGHWQESMAAVLAAAGLLQGLVKGSLALPLTSPVIQALCHILTSACADSQAQAAATEGEQAKGSTVEQPGCVHWRDASALACCNTWQCEPANTVPHRVLCKACTAILAAHLHLYSRCNLTPVKACKLPAASSAVAACVMSCLWDSSLTLKGLFQASALGQAPEKGNAWLESQINSLPMQEAATMARIAAELYRLVNEKSQQACRQILHAGAEQLYEGYRVYALVAPTAWMQSIHSASVRQVLDKAFMSGVLLMTAFWSTAAAKQHPSQLGPPSKRRSKPTAASSTPTGPAAVAVTGNIPGATASGAAATAETSATNPSTVPPTATASNATADILSDSANASGHQTLRGESVLQASSSIQAAEQASNSSLIAAELLDSMSYLQFCRMKLTAYNSLLKNTLTAVSANAEATQHLLNRLPPYEQIAAPASRCGNTGESGQAGREEAVWVVDAILATRMQLLMSLLGACLPALPQGAATSKVAPVMFLYLQYPQKNLAAAAHGLFCALLKHSKQKEELVPFYIQRALEVYPGCTPITGLSAGVDAAMRELPSGSPVVLLTLKSLGKHATELLQQSAKEQQSLQAGLDLVKLLAQMLLVVEHQFLPDALIIAQDAVLNCSDPAVQLAACNCINEVLLTSDDYTRKVKCAQWYQQLAASCVTHDQRPQSVARDDVQQFLQSYSPAS